MHLGGWIQNISTTIIEAFRNNRNFAKQHWKTCRFKNDPHGQVINLSSISVFQRLNKSFNFSPCPLHFNKLTFSRSIQLRAHFEQSAQEQIILDSLKEKKRKENIFNPNNTYVIMQTFEMVIKEDIKTTKNDTYHIKNLTKEHLSSGVLMNI